MNDRLPYDIAIAALTLAVRAPSAGNTQPWRFGVSERGLRLYLDGSRVRSGIDPSGRESVLSCGAVLHHLCVALAALGWLGVVQRLPDPRNPDHLASIGLMRHRPTMTDVALNAAITHRRSDHRPFGSGPVPPGYFGLVSERAAAAGAEVRKATDEPRERLAELMRAPLPAVRTPDLLAPTSVPEIFVALRPVELDRADLLVLGTDSDERESWLRAGEAASAVLLTATNIGLATCLRSWPFTARELRAAIRRRVLDSAAHPQAVVRIGSAPVGPALPFPGRRPLQDILEPLGADAYDADC
ncbi:nitroreductase family protein [Nocardia aurea]|uniref:nitroreductase family protein n=1 Tax=Nocardia aurea TaxID=2144174 RepID=UPI0033A9102E